MYSTWICPTWNRPRLVRELIAQFLKQEPGSHAVALIILDDAGQYDSQQGDDGQGGHHWKLVSFNHPFRTLGDKYNALLAMVDTEITVIAEDDDLYAPHHTAAMRFALEGTSPVAKPTRIRVEYGGQKKVESDPGRFHASLAFRTEFIRQIGGWPTNHRADFDLQMIAKLRSACLKATGSSEFADPLKFDTRESYTFRWETSGHTHAQAYGAGPLDEQWLAKARDAAGPIVKWLGPIHHSARPLGTHQQKS